MKVICLYPGTEGNTFDMTGKRGFFVPRLTVGNWYTIIDTAKYNGCTYYELAEIPPTATTHFMYDANLFGHASSIDETELVNEKEGVI